MTKINDNHLEFLDRLRNSGETNMFGARPYVQKHFGLNTKDAGAILQQWMDTFSERSDKGEVNEDDDSYYDVSDEVDFSFVMGLRNQ